MSSRSALSVVEEKYGSLEELAYHVLENKQEALDETLPLVKRADAVGLPMLTFARILSDPMFRQLLRADLVNKAYTLAEEEAHIKHMVKVATNEERKVVTNKGNVEWIDQQPSDVISAGRYLNELRGTPVEGKRESAFRGVVVNFENVTVNVEREHEQPITIEAAVHLPRRAGDLPAEPVPQSGRGPVSLPADRRTDGGGPLGAFYGDSAKEADEAHALASRGKGAEESPEPEAPRRLFPGPLRQLRNQSRYRRESFDQRPPYDD